MTKTFKRAAALLLAVCLMLPLGAVIQVQADGTEVTAVKTVEYSFQYINAVTFPSADKNGNYNLGTKANLEALNNAYEANKINSTCFAWDTQNKPTVTASGTYANAYCKDWVAFKIQSPGGGDFQVTVEHYSSGSSPEVCNVYILPGDTASDSIASMLTEDYYYGSTDLNDKNALEQNIDNFNSDASAQEYIVVFYAAKDKNGEETTDVGTPFNLVSLTMTQTCTGAAAVITAMEKAPINTQIALSGALTLTEDLENNAAITVSEGAVLDLNGNVLTARSLNAVDGSKVCDSKNNASGVLSVENLLLDDTNGQLPLYDSQADADGDSAADGGYRFFSCSVTPLGQRSSGENSARFWFTIDFGTNAKKAYELIARGDSKLEIKASLSVGDVTYTDGLNFADYVQGWGNLAKNAEEGQTAGLYLNVINLSAAGQNQITLAPAASCAGAGVTVQDPNGMLTYSAA